MASEREEWLLEFERLVKASETREGVSVGDVRRWFEKHGIDARDAWGAALDRQAEEREALERVVRKTVGYLGYRGVGVGEVRAAIDALPQALAARLAADTETSE